ncbi:hypothetical protein K438DRAFT_1776358 [Mycena galopus ATCC 62051]|nr:hypothetical protein K438DRAFT_1776358 [Mycena galopus ATCC 62051]
MTLLFSTWGIATRPIEAIELPRASRCVGSTTDVPRAKSARSGSMVDTLPPLLPFHSFLFGLSTVPWSPSTSEDHQYLDSSLEFVTDGISMSEAKIPDIYRAEDSRILYKRVVGRQSSPSVGGQEHDAADIRGLAKRSA